jgi:hypothetical protein
MAMTEKHVMDRLDAMLANKLIEEIDNRPIQS